ncbi:MAG: acetyltransferase [Neisseria sp.]|nr:acetyltransferase [Neisseria sp.]
MQTTRKKLAIVGAGGHGKVVAATALAAALWTEIVFVDDEAEGEILGLPVSGCTGLLGMSILPAEYDLAVAVGNNAARERLCRRFAALGFALPAVVHPSTVIAPDVEIGAGCVVFAQAVIQPCCRIGDGAIINTAATVDHDCVLGGFVHVSPGAHLAGGTQVGGGSWIGIGACTRQLIRIGTNVVVGAGAAVVSDVADGLTVVGNPAKPLRGSWG